MFGAPKTPASGGLFGQSQNNTQQQSTGGLFGAKPATSGLGGGLFGASNSSSQQPAQPGQQQGSLFGQAGQPPQAGTGGGLGAGLGSNTGMSSSQAAQPAFGVSTGNSLAQGANSSQTSIALGQQTQQPQQQQQPVITPFTRPSDLPESFQKELENMDIYIRQQAQLSEDLSHAMTDHKALVTSTPRDVQLLRFKLTSAKETLKFDDGQLAKLKALVDTDYGDSELLAEVTNQPRKYDRLLPYFRRRVSCDSQLDQLALAMRDVQHAVTAEEFGKRITYNDQGLRALPKALREEYMYFMSLSDRVAELHRHIKDSGEGEALEGIQL